MKRVFLIVLDSFGIGAMTDAESFGDVGVNTLRACATSPKLDIPNMTAAGLGNIDGVTCLHKAAAPTGAFARLTESSMGKDTTIGHWEIAGVISPQPLPTFPNGFPREVLDAFEKETGRGVLCNLPYSGTDVIRDYGEEQRKPASGSSTPPPIPCFRWRRTRNGFPCRSCTTPAARRGKFCRESTASAG